MKFTKERNTIMVKIIVSLIAIIIIIFLCVGTIAGLQGIGEFKYVSYQGKIVVLYTTNQFWTKVYLDNGTIISIPSKFKLQYGTTYKFTYRKYDNWMTHDSIFDYFEFVK